MLPRRAILAEWRGCGKSDAPYSDDDLEMSHLANDYADLLKTLDIDKVNVVGHSTGGLIALLAMLHYPEYFAKAVLLDPVGAKGIVFPPTMTDAFIEMAKNRAFTQFVMTGTVHKVDTSWPLFQALVDDAFRAVPLIGLGIIKNLSKFDISSELANIKHPILVLHGEHDQVLPKADSQFLAENIPNARFVEIPAHGHSTNVEDPQLFTSIVDEFFQENYCFTAKKVEVSV